MSVLTRPCPTAAVLNAVLMLVNRPPEANHQRGAPVYLSDGVNAFTTTSQVGTSHSSATRTTRTLRMILPVMSVLSPQRARACRRRYSQDAATTTAVRTTETAAP